ncbi:hypothetical protein HJFPF1_03535 [Paramyrothecium foliicola]|nr:hypothetical protein HJFPF1_03535 [Paramyrothecium foliicola]
MNSLPGLRLGPLPGLFRTCVRHSSTYRGSRKTGKGYETPEGHGEKIWVFSHRKTDQIIYSFKGSLDGFHGHKQIPFNGKKLKPAKLRKDYWYPMALIEFPSGQGAVGRSAYQKLRELKHLHEVAWGDEIRYKNSDTLSEKQQERAKAASTKGRDYKVLRTKRERGQALNALKPFSVADMAAVLAGQGAGNKVLSGGSKDNSEQLVGVTVRWSNNQDKNLAEEWSANVTHDLLGEPAYVVEVEGTGSEVPKQVEKPAADAAALETAKAESEEAPKEPSKEASEQATEVEPKADPKPTSTSSQ